MKRISVVVLFVLAALLYFMVGRYQTAWLCSIFKILPSLLLFMAVILSRRKDGYLRKGVLCCLAALFFSMIGDVFGEWKGSPCGLSAFVLQIASFAVAQIFYAISFAEYFRKDPSVLHNVFRILLCVCLAVYMIWFGMYVLSFVEEPSLNIAVPVYVILIGTMGLFSIIQFRKRQGLFIIGALLFILSDSVIAYRSFVGPVPRAGLIIMSTYYAAQLLLNISLVKCNDKH